jgi:hypothetical protein
MKQEECDCFTPLLSVVLIIAKISMTRYIDADWAKDTLFCTEIAFAS